MAGQRRRRSDSSALPTWPRFYSERRSPVTDVWDGALLCFWLACRHLHEMKRSVDVSSGSVPSSLLIRHTPTDECVSPVGASGRALDSSTTCCRLVCRVISWYCLQNSFNYVFCFVPNSRRHLMSCSQNSLGLSNMYEAAEGRKHWESGHLMTSWAFFFLNYYYFTCEIKFGLKKLGW